MTATDRPRLRSTVLTAAWARIPGVEVLSSGDGGPLTRTIKKIIDPLVIRTAANPRLGRPLLEPPAAAELTELLLADAPRLRATAEWFTHLKRQRRALRITAGDVQDVCFPLAYELATGFGMPGPEAPETAAAALRDLHGDGGEAGVGELGGYLADPRVAGDLTAELHRRWEAAGGWVTPGGRALRGEPVSPADPALPGLPAQAGSATDPALPSGAVPSADLVSRGDPALPGGPASPADPVLPGDSALPGDLASPGDPVLLGDQASPADPAPPADLASPADPVLLGYSASPANPASPADPTPPTNPAPLAVDIALLREFAETLTDPAWRALADSPAGHTLGLALRHPGGSAALARAIHAVSASPAPDLGLQRGDRTSIPPLRRQDETGAELLERSVERRVRATLRRLPLGERGPVAGLVEDELRRVVAGFGLGVPVLATCFALGVVLAPALRPLDGGAPAEVPEFARQLNAQVAREGYVLHARRALAGATPLTPQPDPELVADLRDFAKQFLGRLWIRLHGFDVRGDVPADAADVRDLVTGVVRSTSLDLRTKVRRALVARLPDLEVAS